MEDNLLDLDNAVDNAADWLESAQRIAGNLLTDPHTGEAIPWKKMGEAADLIGKALVLVFHCLDPVQDVIEVERNRADDGPDEIDAHGFKDHPMA